MTETIDHLLDQVRSLQMPLTASIPIDTVRSTFVFEVPQVRDWLTDFRKGLSAADTQHIQNFPSDDECWYVARKNSIFGPVSLRALSDLNLNGGLSAEDQFFSLKNRTSLKAIPDLGAHSAPQVIFHKREAQRARLECIVQISAGQEYVTGITEDISPLGLRVYCKSNLPIGETISVHFAIPGVDTELSVDAIVVQASTKANSTCYGLQFVDRQPSLQKTLEKYFAA